MNKKQILEDDHPIFEACKNGDLSVVEKYLNEGVSVYAESEHNSVISGIAAHHKHKDVLELLLKNGLDIVEPYNGFGSSLAEIAIRQDDVDWLGYYLAKGIPIDYQDNHGYSLLMLASAGGRLNSTKYLLANQASLETKSQSGTTAFREAARNNQIETMQLLLNAGSDIETRDSKGITPLIGAAKGGKYEAVEWLLENGADINAEDKRGKCALDWAKANNHQNIVDLIQERLGS